MKLLTILSVKYLKLVIFSSLDCINFLALLHEDLEGKFRGLFYGDSSFMKFSYPNKSVFVKFECLAYSLKVLRVIFGVLMVDCAPLDYLDSAKLFFPRFFSSNGLETQKFKFILLLIIAIKPNKPYQFPTNLI